MIDLLYSDLFIRKYAELFEFPSKAHLEAVIQISRGHRKTDLQDECIYPIELPTPDGDTICLPYLAALIRLADEIDVTANRRSVITKGESLWKRETPRQRERSM